MKRAALLLLLALPMFAITGTPSGKRGLRVGVLRSAGVWQGDELIAATDVERETTAQLRRSGVEAWDTSRTIEMIRDEDLHDADLFVEISGGDARVHQVGDVGVGDRHVSATLGVLMSKVAAEVRVYDGRTLELIDQYDLSRRKTAVVPTSIGFGTRDLFAYAALPIFRHVQYRSAVREVAEEAAKRISTR
jgi:hypothetical protein